MADKLTLKGNNLTTKSGKVWFQYNKTLNFPIFITFPEKVFSTYFESFLMAHKWFRLAENESKTIDIVLKEKNAKVLVVEECSPVVARSLRAVGPGGGGDSFFAGSNESIGLKEGVRFYKYQNEAMFLYSFVNSESKMGCFQDFGSKEKIARHIINRFLSLALSAHGIIGFWGMPVEEGIVVMRPEDAESRVVFIDIFKRNIFSDEGVTKIAANCKIFRLNSLPKSKSLKMRQEELFSFLYHHCAYFDIQGPSAPVRQVIQEMAKTLEGVWLPFESFRPRLESNRTT